MIGWVIGQFPFELRVLPLPRGKVPPSRMIGPLPGTAKPPVGFVAAFCALAVPVTTASPSVRPLLISAVVFVTSPTSTALACGCPSAPRTITL